MQDRLLNNCIRILARNKLDEKSTQKYELIKEMLQVPNCFEHMRIDTAINVLMDLGYTKNDAKEVYMKLTKFKK